MKKYVIITSSDEKNGGFLVNHWYKSLKLNVKLENIDIVVIDYGLNNLQKNALIKNRVTLFKGTKKFRINNERFFDAYKYLEHNHYDQVLLIDGADIIFQNDISQGFELHQNEFRVVIQSMPTFFFELHISDNFSKNVRKNIWETIKNKSVINAGVIFAPYKKFINLCKVMKKLIKDKNSWGPDQIILNYYLHKNGFKAIDNKYNFVITTEEADFSVKKGVFYKSNGEKIAVVHNSGRMNFFRPINNFGYGNKFNQLKNFIYNMKKTQYRLIEAYKKTLQIKP